MQNKESGYQYMSKSDETFVYDGKDKSAWYLLLAEKGMNLTKNKLDYIKDPLELARRSTEPIAPAHIPWNGPLPEPLPHKEARFHLMRRMEKEYDTAKTQWIRDTRKMEDDFGLAIAILMQHVSEDIRKDLYVELAEAGRRGENNQQKYHSAWNKLMAEHGPFSQQDIENMRKDINVIDMDALGVKEAIQKFKETIISMSMTPVRDANRNILYSPAQVNHAALPARPAAGALPLEIAAYWNALLAEEALAATRQGPMLTHAPSNEQIKTYLINMLQRSKLIDFHKIYVESLKPINHGWDHITIMTDIDALVRHGPQGIDLGGSASKPKNTRFIGTVRELKVDEEAPQRNLKRERSVDSRGSETSYHNFVCTNCRGNHHVRDCTSTKCGHCGKRFETIRERKNHWGITHATKPYDANKSKKSSSASPYTGRQRQNSPYPKRASSSKARGYNSDASNRSANSNRSHDYYRDRRGDKKHSVSGSISTKHRYKQNVVKKVDNDQESVQSNSSHGSVHSYQKH